MARIGLLLEDLEWVKDIAHCFKEKDYSIEIINSHKNGCTIVCPEGELIIGKSDYAPGVAVALEALHELSVSTVYRIGTCGGYLSETKIGEIVCCSAAIRGEGTSTCYIRDRGFPAVGDHAELERLGRLLRLGRTRVHNGILWTTDGRVVGPYEPARIQEMKTHNVAGVEMETAAFYIVAHRLGMRAASASVIIDLPESDGKFSAVASGSAERISLGLYVCFRSIPMLLTDK